MEDAAKPIVAGDILDSRNHFRLSAQLQAIRKVLLLRAYAAGCHAAGLTQVCAIFGANSNFLMSHG